MSTRELSISCHSSRCSAAKITCVWMQEAPDVQSINHQHCQLNGPCSSAKGAHEVSCSCQRMAPAALRRRRLANQSGTASRALQPQDRPCTVCQPSAENFEHADGRHASCTLVSQKAAAEEGRLFFGCDITKQEDVQQSHQAEPDGAASVAQGMGLRRAFCGCWVHMLKASAWVSSHPRRCFECRVKCYICLHL